jgi:histidinol phosphatase-like enzyme
MIRKNFTKKELELARKLCENECTEIYVAYDVDLVYDHYDAEVGIFYLFLSDTTTNKPEDHMLENLRKNINSINKRWYVGIIKTDLEAYEASRLDSELKNKKF